MPARSSVLQGCCVSCFIDVEGDISESELRTLIKSSFPTGYKNCVIRISEGHPFVNEFTKAKKLHVTTVAKGEYLIQGDADHFRDIVLAEYNKKLEEFLKKTGRKKGQFEIGDKVLVPSSPHIGICTVYGLSHNKPHRMPDGTYVHGPFIEYGGSYKGQRNDQYGSGWSPTTLELVLE